VLNVWTLTRLKKEGAHHLDDCGFEASVSSYPGGADVGVWLDDAMMEALESVRVGRMSINQAAIHYNLPYSSLYGRFKHGKYDIVGAAAIVTNFVDTSHVDHSPENTMQYISALPQTPTPINNGQQQIQHHSILTSLQSPPTSTLSHNNPTNIQFYRIKQENS
jgi:hypothetical protein